MRNLICSFPLACVVAGCGLRTAAQALEARWPFYVDGAAAGVRVQPWKMKWEERNGGTDRSGKCLWFNSDWKAHPWAGVTFELRKGAERTLDADWCRRGFLRFFVNVGADRYGYPGGGVRFQARPICDGTRYQAVRNQFIDRGRGMDEDLATWQEVLVPLSYWTSLQPGDRITGVSIQCRQKPARTFGLDRIELVRFAQVPEWLIQAASRPVAQPQVRWPAYKALPDVLKADRHPPRTVDGQFVGPDGRRVFLLGPYCREDPRLDLWGTIQPEKRAPNLGLYDPKTHGWIYEDLPTVESLCRLGFNYYSATMPPQPWWDAAGLRRKDGAHSDDLLPGAYARLKLPFYVDTVAWPWSVGRPHSANETDLPPDAFTQGRNHWTPWRIIGEGRRTWLRMWRLYARRYHEAGVPVLMFELMNEPAYVGMSDDHRREFPVWLRKRYRTLTALNRTWGASLERWEQAAAFKDDRELAQIIGRRLDYDEYLADRFTELIAEGVNAVQEILPDTLVGVQTMGGYALRPREAVWKHRLVRVETVVITPTGGGRWTRGAGCSRPPDSPLDESIARAPFEDDLLLALSGRKMIFDNETYLRGQTAREVRNRLWEQVLAGLDGLTVFAWSKRGWAWWRGREAVQVEADKFPYSNLIPLARRTEALRGILDFATEVQALAPMILPKPRGPRPAVGLLYSWAHARWMSIDPELVDKTGDYYAALKYTHWNFAIVPSDGNSIDSLTRFDVLVAPALTHVERDLVQALRDFVRQGGVLLVGEQPLDRDLYGAPLDAASWLGVAVTGLDSRGATVTSPSPARIEARLPGPVRLPVGVRKLRIGPEASVVVQDAAGRPVIVRHRFGKGIVYYQAADVIGYPLAKLLWRALADAAKESGRSADSVPARWRLADIRNAKTGTLAANVLLSRRSWPDRHALLLMNMDEYARSIRIAPADIAGRWQVRDALRGRDIRGPSGPVWSDKDLHAGVPIDMPPGDPVVLLLRPAPAN